MTSSRIQKLSVDRQQGWKGYGHQAFVSCLTGLYSCQWKHHQHTGSQFGHFCCSKLECGSFAVIIVTFCLSLVFLYFWTEAQNDYNDFDWFNFGNLGFWFPWSMVLLVTAAVFFTYIAFLLLLSVCLLSEGQRLYLHWGHKIGILVTLIFSIAATAVLSDLWNEKWETVLLSFQMTAPYLQVGGVLLMIFLSWPLASHLFCLRQRVRRMVIIALCGAVLISLYLVPLGMYSPCIKERNSLGPAPALIGHRGAPMLAPENTYMSFEKVVAAGGDGLETDVTISYDGMPFLMHDKSLRRTTNVEDIFPNRTRSPAAMFTWNELQQLNAGAWFFSQNPFKTASSLSPEDRTQAQNQSVCTLRAVLELAAQYGKLVIFDLYRPPRGHPYRDMWISRTLEVIQSESSIHSSQVLWLPPELRELVQETDPELQQTSGSLAPVEELQHNHIVRLNLHYSSMSEAEISKYSAVNISTNLYVVSEPWLFSLAWCAGVHSVTTNAVHILKSLRRPLFFMTPQEYSAMWVLTDMVSLIVILAVFIFHWWKEHRVTLCSGRNTIHDNGRSPEFRTGMNDVWSLTML
ncbi:glycerophosphodiester phosphodiesterase domain-containing protein 5 isoform X2 [Colossoma macropomum]|uniref:glycerophosphodiester phosphodiesterase domain-containing protein 5 isoform X2 n=1 Tax=Colossoma macropomum TaxID=42526 RepID=UPI001863E09D|nr:glycerophosphodiester phosphodiesterase domain-containing protein 5 isoform X2 [Colossoma macropomum]